MALSPSIQLVWGQAYWGGDVALIGGALVYGGVPRLVARPRVGAALITGLGLAVLANSRPFEGLCASAPAAIALLVWLLGRRRPTLAVAAAKVVLPIVGVLAVAAAGMAYHNLRTTGDPLTMPYIVYERTYGMGPVFLWDPPRPQPRYRHPIMEKYYAGWAMGTYRMQLGPWNLLKVKGSQILGLWRFFLGPTLTVPLLALPWVLKKRRNLLAAACVATTLAGLLGACWIHPHYFAPAVPALFLLVVQGMRYVAQWRWRGRPVGRPLVFGLVVVYAVVFIAAAGHHFKNAELTGERMARTLESIGRQPGKHLVVVRYGPDHNLHDEWVYNAADIDAAKVVLARDMSPQENDELLRYFADRRVWLLQADAYRVQAYRR